MNFYHILFGLKHGFNRNLTWYENLFVRFYNNTIAKLVARILRIKGNTVSFNQLVQNGNFADTSGWTKNNNADTLTIANNIATFVSADHSQQFRYFYRPFTYTVNHKYFVSVLGKVSATLNVCFTTGNREIGEISQASTDGWKKNAFMFTANSGDNTYGRVAYFAKFGDIQVQNFMLFDLTLMGIDNLTTTAEVEQWLSSHIGDLPYFDYTQGTLIPFMGSGLKTVGKNQYNNATGLKNLYLNQNTGSLGNGGTTYVADILPNKQYTLSGTRGNRSLFGLSKKQANEIGNRDVVENILSVSLPYTFNSSDYHSVVYYSNTDYVATLGTDVQLEFGSTTTTYEPYTSNTLSLPTSTYFPTGMKSAGSVYDELSDKAYTRIGSVDLGSLGWTYENNGRFSSELANGAIHTLDARQADGMMCSMYIASTSGDNMTFFKYQATGWALPRMYFYNTNYSDAQSFKEGMSGVMLYYELATPTETDISLDLTYPIQWGGTEQILPVNTSTPTTSGIVADIKYPDGIRYDQTFVYRVIEKATQLGNRALSIMLGKKVETDNPEEPLDILLKGEK